VLLLLLAIVFFSLVVALGLLARNEQRRHSPGEHWRAAAAELGLTVSRPKQRDLKLHGVLEGVPLRADLRHDQQGKVTVLRCTLCLGKDGRIPESLEVHADSLLRSMARLVEGEDQQVGDPDFDQLVELPVLDARACAALSFGARGHLARLIERGGEVRQGLVTYSQIWSEDQDQVWLVRMLRWLAKLARLLSVPPDGLHQRLADNALEDPSPGVRLRNVRFLADPSTQTPEALLVPLGRRLLGDVNPRVRLLAAQFVGAEGHRVLGALVADATLETPLRVAAVTGLGRGPTPALAELQALFTTAHPPEVVCAALAVIAQQGLSALADAALGCTRSAQESVRAAAASALGGLGLPAAEPLLISLLSDSSAEVQRASADALGVLGSVAAVEPLLPLAEGFGRSALRQAARGAIGRIQSRLGNVEAGRVSLAEDQGLAGAVDLAEPDAVRIGELSLAEESTNDPDGSAAGSAVPGPRAR
jgi:hypothetical protein